MLFVDRKCLVLDWKPVENGREPSFEHPTNDVDNVHGAQADQSKTSSGSATPPPRKLARKAKEKSQLTLDQMNDQLDLITTGLRRPGTSPTLSFFIFTMSNIICFSHFIAHNSIHTAAFIGSGPSGVLAARRRTGEEVQAGGSR
jgi:hypothetical protein